MRHNRWLSRRPLFSTAKRSLLPLLFALAVFYAGAEYACAAEQPAQAPAAPAAPAEQTILPAVPVDPSGPSALMLNLAQCLRLALERSPRIAVQRASLAGAQDGQRALDALLMPNCLNPQLSVRRRQAALGVTAAAAGLESAEQETSYAVSRTYVTALFAREQERIAGSVITRLTAIRDTAQQQVEAGARGVTVSDVNRTNVFLGLAQTRQIQASQGVKRAMVALKEAIGLGPEVCLDIPLEPLPQPVACPDRNEMIALALARRGFLIQVGLFAQIVCLEVEAQGTSLHRKVQTFAAGADIHSRPVVQGTSNSEYRPGAVPPEMPIQLVGSRAERMQHAQSLHTRALALVEVTRNLITLEVEDAVLRWQEAAEQARQAQQAVTAGDKLSRALNRDFVAGQNVKVEEVVNAWVLASQAQSQYNEFLYRQLLALLDLERATGRGFCAGLFGVTVLAASPAPAAVSGTR